MKRLNCLFFSLILPSLLQAKVPYVPYEEAFPCEQASPQYNPGLNEKRAIYKSLYENYYSLDIEESDYLIPPLIHFIWLGSQIPAYILPMIQTWKEHHPGWIIKIWTDEDVEPFGLQNKQAFDQALAFAQQADIFRYEILYRFGGLYVDIDFECLKPFDALHKSCEFYTGICEYNNDLYNGLIGSVPRHPILKACIDNLKVIINPKNTYDTGRILEDTGPYYFRKIFLSLATSCEPGKTVAFPATFFYPIPGIAKEEVREQKTRENYLKPESMCIHYWNAGWGKI